TIADEDTVRAIAELSSPRQISVHVKVDTGMGRMGCMPEKLHELIRTVRVTRCLHFTGLYSHFATADLRQRDLALKQLSTFNHLLTAIRVNLPPGVIRHIANSAATITLPD